VTARVGTVDVPRISIDPDRTTAARYGVAASDIVETTRLALGGVEVTRLYEAERTIDVVMRLAVAPTEVEAIGAIAIATPDGTRLPLSALASIRLDASPRAIVRESGARVVAVRVHVADDDQGAELRRALDRIALPAGYRLIATSSSSSADLP
jgi:cobalt-zinc-cadmium resistance protein CzcA